MIPGRTPSPCGPTVLNRDQLHQLRTLHAALRNAQQLVWTGTDPRTVWAATVLYLDCEHAVAEFWRGVHPNARR